MTCLPPVDKFFLLFSSLCGSSSSVITYFTHLWCTIGFWSPRPLPHPLGPYCGLGGYPCKNTPPLTSSPNGTAHLSSPGSPYQMAMYRELHNLFPFWVTLPPHGCSPTRPSWPALTSPLVTSLLEGSPCVTFLQPPRPLLHTLTQPMATRPHMQQLSSLECQRFMCYSNNWCCSICKFSVLFSPFGSLHYQGLCFYHWPSRPRIQQLRNLKFLTEGLRKNL